MPSRIDVELTSARPDGTWTWRAAGAREPRGVVESAVLPDGAKVGDIFKVEATIALDGIEIHSVVPARSHRKESERIEILGGSEFQAVTTSLVGKRGTLGIMQPATDGKYLYFAWRDDLGDIWVMDALRR